VRLIAAVQVHRTASYERSPPPRMRSGIRDRSLPDVPGEVRSFDTGRHIVYCIHKGYRMRVKPERYRKDRIEEVDVSLSAH
jgi:hypothetical protein